MASYVGVPPNNPAKYLGPNITLESIVTRNRAPTGADIRQGTTGQYYPIGSLWIISKDPTTGTQGDLWYLSTIIANVAYWIMISSGSSGPTIGFNVPLGSSPVFPTLAGLVTFTSTGGTISITGSTNTINFDLSGGTIATDSFQVDTFTPPGTQPVVPTIAGLVTVTGAQVAPGTVGANVIRSASLAANTITYQIQQTSAVTSKDTTKNGVAHFKSSQFTNDQGFVALNFVPIVQVKSTAFSSNGTYTPTAGMINCSIEILGGGGAGGGAPATGAGEVSAGSGGGAGEYAVGDFTAAQIGASQTITIGAAGAGVSGGNGGNGGNSSVGALITANGGGGGVSVPASATATARNGGVGGTGGTGGDIHADGGRGFSALANFPAGFGWSGQGADSQYGSGGFGTFTGAGGAASGFGAGGGGSEQQSSSSAVTGGAGAAGIVFITEYIGLV